MTLPSDPAEALKWAFNHSNEAWWVIGLIAGGVAWTSKRLRDWNRRNAIPIGRTELRSSPWSNGAPPAPAAAPAGAQAATSAAPTSTYTAAASYAAAAYAAQPAYAAPVAAPSANAPARKLHREMPAQRAVTPVGRSVNVPAAAVATGAWTLAGAFGDPAHARTAVVIAEVLGPPPGLR